MSKLLFMGLGGTAIALTLARISAGVFFAISGFHKLFHSGRRSSLGKTLAKAGIPGGFAMVLWVAGVELFAGLAVAFGLLTPLAAAGLLVICLVALWRDALPRIASWSPINEADWLATLLYLVEVTYALLFLWLIAEGAGPWSLDALVMMYL